jgi:hypothetical protein
MSQIIKKISYLFLLAIVPVVFAGCSSSSSSSDSVHNPDEGHPSNWETVHGSSFLINDEQCTECHGSTLRGGISRVSCFSASYGGISCHPAGPPGHPLPYTDPAVHGPDAKADLTSCQGCHADPSDGGPGSHPRFTVEIGNLTAGCETPGCHDLNTAHPVPWSSGPNATNHPTAGSMARACVLCHGANLEGDIDGGPACSNCHTNGSPLTAKNCTSCHGKPPLEAICNEVTDLCE